MDISSKVVLDDNQLVWKKQVLESFKKHKQGALHLATSTGKSYIAKDIIDNLLCKDNDAEVLWISNAASLENIINNIFKANTKEEMELYSNITFLSFETMRMTENFIDNFEFKKLRLIVIDEVHKSLAKKTYKSIRYAIDKLTKGKTNRTNLLVMTASDVRSCDKKQVFKELVPKLQAGIDYPDIGLSEAIDQDLLCKIHFLHNNLYKYELMVNSIIKRVSSEFNTTTFKNKGQELKNMLTYIEKYNNSLALYLGGDLHNKIKNEYDGKEGNSWVVFYNTVDKALNSEKLLIELFTNIYKHNINVKINVYQYHNKMSKKENEEVNKLMYAEPKENTVNVFVTVMKGIESIHPVNMTGIIMFRSTSSLNLYEQAIGRTTRAKKYGNKAVYVVDVAGNRESVENGKGFFSSLNEPENMLGISIEEENKLSEKLKESFFDNIDFSLMNENFENIVSEYYLLRNYDVLKKNAEIIANIIREEVGKNFKTIINYNPYKILNKVNKCETLSNILSSMQTKFINREFGKYTCNSEDTNITYNMLYSTLGDLLFVNSVSLKNNVDYTELRKLALGSKNKELLNKYRLKFIKSEIPLSACEYLRFYNVDLKGKNTDLVKLALDDSKICKDIKSSFHRLCKMLDNVDKSYSITDLEKAYAYYMYLNTRYTLDSTFNAINITYKCLADVNDIKCVKRGKNLAIALAQCVKMNEKGSHLEGTKYDDWIIKIAKEISNKQEFSSFEHEILKLYDINTKSSRYNLMASKLMQYTNINNILNRLEDSKLSIEDKFKVASRLKGIVLYALPSEWKKMVEKAIDKYLTIEKDDSYELEEIISKCRYKINKLSEITNEADIKSVERAYKTARKNNISDGEIMATCFTPIYHEYMSKAINNMINKSLTDDDKLIINGSFSISENYSEKLMFLVKYSIINSESSKTADKLIRKLVE